MNPNDRLLSLEVYRHGKMRCTNGGISDSVDHIYIPCPDGPTKVMNIATVLIFIPEHRGGCYWALKPLLGREDMIGPMDGGNIATTSDSRGESMIYHIHDRYETQEEYDSNWP